MPSPNQQEPENGEMEKLLLKMLPDIPVAVRKACHSLGHHPDQSELDGIVQRIVVLLLDNDFHTLRSFDNGSKPQTWLFTIAKRFILRQRQRQKRELRLEEMPPDSFATQPVQEEQLVSEEMERVLLAAAGKLTAHEQKLFSLLLRGLKPGEVAKEMGIKKKSVYSERSVLIRKLRRVVSRE